MGDSDLCGIAGLVWSDKGRVDGAPASVRAMTAELSHRGPDADGFWHCDNAAFGHRRLSIIDLTTGDQPMQSPTGMVVTYNGEIYNFVELREELEDEGLTFKTNSDTEILLALYERDGEKCVDRLNGMFAFAIWDASRHRLFMARDRLGKKPFYYMKTNGVLAFASEIKALLAWTGAAEQDVDVRSLSDVLTFGYVLTPKTMFKGIRRLPGGHSAIYDPKADKLEISEYWNPATLFNAPPRPYDAAAQEEFRALFEDAVRIRLRSDVPLGGFLSGGVDSSAIVAEMAKLSDMPPKTFTVGFDDASFDETPYAKTVADHLGVPFKVLEQPDASASTMSHLVWHLDEPFADTSILPTWKLNGAAAREVKVALSGDGGDELLAGYPTYRADAYYAYYRHVPLFMQRVLSWLANKILKPSYGKVSWDYKARQFLGAHGLSTEHAHLWWRVIFSEDEKRRMLSPTVLAELGDYDPLKEAARFFQRVQGASFLNQTLYVDMKTWLEDDILVKADRMSMANSLEVRSPFLDYRVVELMAGIEDKAKLDGGIAKVALKDMMRDVLPEGTIRRRKQGFNAPFQGGDGAVLGTAGFGDLFKEDFVIDPKTEDVTFKSFVLSVLKPWLGMARTFQAGGRWRCADD
ncbi:MAG: asparagine synthase (glutamine-hydrolyzing) [Rhodospirillaceae bacterium]|nr:asparagine synthase (glutamine-hydrolyzing) [Rhodospirillaceae bacterium]MBT7356907.1 asparagine synthase (glutamine-hydrolyzing) [Rhodospirillaceae bacterium]